MFTFLQSIILGLVQGLTEFIPVSSSGHLVLTQVLMAGASDHYFIAFLDLGTTLVLIIYFRKKIYEILHNIFIDRNIRLARNILLTAIPAGIVGYLLSDFINTSWFFGSVVVVAIGLIVVGTIMIILERLPKASHVKNGEALPAKRALVVGIVQVLALIPGVSRSGSTIIAGRLAGLSAKEAAEYSFLAALPIMLGVALKLFAGSTERAYLMTNLSTVVVSNIFAFIAGMIAVTFMLNYLKRHSLAVFGWYRVALGVIVLTTFLLVQ
ncbi:MAG: undecaprenyl-diphosphate phosphatase [Candidatus Microsaccharimonas sossegonensis]|uniref:Undecaprenyl-diphosphatase n=1 Tax=Candidatus Microsaccharimonas sossegonensis TaxID=2506948 RepID=A0A4Q0AH22_9BACT|nr:MAG: undecaprenyl-diphosphate phosphatase [Candidatus Microsaccharimonas sossegonensis]